MATLNDAGGILYVVATPIGNSEDISARALRILAEVDLIACEDTRRTGRLLAEHSIQAPTVSYFEHNEERRASELVQKLRAGAKIALVSDAGTPTISDPGYRLVRAAIKHNIRVVSVPGPNAAIAALSVAGLATDRFAFEGFLPTKTAARRGRLARVAREDRTLIFFEAGRRLGALLTEMESIFGGDREAVVARELTKTHEEIVRGTLAELAVRYSAEEVLGEVTLVVAGAERTDRPEVSEGIDEPHVVEILRDAGLSLKQAADVVSRLTGSPRRDIYQRAVRSEKS